MSYPDSENATVLLFIVIVLSFVIASSLSIYPLSPSMATWRPMVMIMVLIYWLLFQPRYVGSFTAFTTGLAADLLMDTHLGQQAFAATLVALFIKSMSRSTKQLNTLKAWALASLGLILFQLTLWGLQTVVQDAFFVKTLSSLLISIISWPLVLLVLRKFAS